MATTLKTSLSDSGGDTAVNPVPVGAVMPYCSADAPDGWLLCNGQAIDEATYPDLYALVGGSVPDLRSRFIVGVGQGSGLSSYALDDTGGAESITLDVTEMPSHSHYGLGEYDSSWPYGTYSPSGKADNMGSEGSLDNDNWLYGTTSTGGGAAHENRPPYYALTFVIKY